MYALIAAMLAFQPVSTAPAPQAPSEPTTDIVVIAQRNSEALAKCLRAGCPPIDDIKASIAVAEHDFAAGDYRGARAVLAQSISRNKRHAGELPTAVAALYEASSNVNLHYGDQRAYRSDVANRVRILRDSAPAGSAQRVLGATLLGDMWLTLGYADQAEMSYRSAASVARDAGQAKLATYIELRRAALHLAGNRAREASDLLREVEASPFARDPGVNSAILAMRVRVASARKDGAALDQALAGLASLPPANALVLVKSDPIRSSAAMDAETNHLEWGTPVGNIALGSSAISWIDVGFAVAPDGRTHDVEVLRGRMGGERTKAVLAQIGSRRYAPFVAEDGAVGAYRVERYTLRSPLALQTGSIIRRRAGAAQLEMIDITRTHAPPPATN